ncbi:MAG TPA: ATP-dependent DNA helicase [Propionibacteriaceae bacterium]|nr:ATP-dependent DNA helicase [Propionibacteriaceae bacterium]
MHSEQSSGPLAAGDPDGPVLVVGGPGTGKTTALVEAVASLVRAGTPLERIAVFAGSRPSAQELRGRIVRDVGGAQRQPKVSTMHAFCLGLVRRYGEEGPSEGRPLTLLTAPEQEFRVRELLAHHDVSRWPAELLDAVGTRGFAAEVRAILARSRQLGLDPEDLVRAGEAASRPDWVAVGTFLEEYLTVIGFEAVIDYAELIHRARVLLTSSEVSALVSAEISYVFCDEFAELDPSQASFLADLARAGCRVRAFADPSTSAYGFRGADPRAVRDFAVRFASPGVTVSRIDLDRNHRNSLAVARACAGIAARLPEAGGVRGAAPDADAGDGEVRAVVFRSVGDEAEHIADVLRRAHLVDQIPWDAMAVVSRSGHTGLALMGRQLLAAGVPVEIAGDEIALSAERSVRPLLLAMKAVRARARGEALDPGDALLLLKSPLGGLDSVAVRRLSRALRAADAAQRDDEADGVGEFAIGRPSSVLIAEALQGGGLVGSLGTPEAEKVLALSSLLDSVGVRVQAGCAAHEALWELWDGTTWPGRLRAIALSGGEDSERAHRDLDAVCALFDLAGRSTHFFGVAGLDALLEAVESQEIPADTARESDLTGRGVRLLTAHRCKGLQWRLVIVTDVQEGTWPNLRHRHTILEPERLSRDGLLSGISAGELLAQERRLLLLACSRASEKLLVCAVEGGPGEANAPSRFLAELGVDVELMGGRAAGPRPLTVAALVAELRRTVVDPEVALDLRAAAAARLAGLADARDGRGSLVAPAADPDRWWGMAELSESDAPLVGPGQPVRLSGSSLEKLLGCPRHWFLSQQARAERQHGQAANLGSVIHVLAQHADELTPDELPERLDDVWEHIQFDAAWLEASERADASSALERYVEWGSATVARELVGVEVEFSVEVPLPGERVVLAGKVDRLERDAEGRLVIVDLKTGRQALTRGQAEASDQLGAYQLVVKLGGFEHVVPGERRCGGGELVYLRQPAKAGSLLPKVMAQPSLDTKPHLDADPTSGGHESWVHQRLAEGARIVRTEKFVARPCVACRYCKFAYGCPTTASAKEI